MLHAARQVGYVQAVAAEVVVCRGGSSGGRQWGSKKQKAVQVVVVGQLSSFSRRRAPE